MKETEVPGWAAKARAVFRALLIVYVLLWLIRGILAVVDLIFDTDLFDGSSPRWLDVTVYALASVWLVSGLVWLAGALVNGYREPRRR